MPEWTVSIDVPASVGDDQADILLEHLAVAGAALSVGEDTAGVTMTVTASDALAAGKSGVRAWQRALERAGVESGPPTVLEVMTTDEHDRRLAESPIPELWSAGEVADELRVSRQRVHQLVSDNPRFPPPILRPLSGPLWLADTIRAFAASWERRPGRPRVIHAATQEKAVEAAREAVRNAGGGEVTVSPATGIKRVEKAARAGRKKTE